MPWVPIDGAVPQRSGGVVVGVIGADQLAAESVDRYRGRLVASVTDWFCGRCRHRFLLSTTRSHHREPPP
jgi:hypothetical protein